MEISFESPESASAILGAYNFYGAWPRPFSIATDSNDDVVFLLKSCSPVRPVPSTTFWNYHTDVSSLTMLIIESLRRDIYLEFHEWSAPRGEQYSDT